MDLATAEFLSSTAGNDLLEAAEKSGKTDFALAQYLRKRTTPDLAAALCTTLELRRKALRKFTRAEQMLFTRNALEQASAEDISRHRTSRLTKHNIGSIADLGCAVGGDSIAFSADLKTIGVELDPARLRLAEHNIEVYQHRHNFTPLNADIIELDPSELGVESFFIDPARRTSTGKRLFSPESWSPKLSEVYRWLGKIPEGAIKAAPGIDHADIPKDATAEFISYNGELRECVLWFGRLRSERKLEATLLPQGITLSGENPKIDVTEVSEYLYEPDSAVLRAGLVELLASQIDATKISAPISLLTGTEPQETSFATRFKVLKTIRFNEKELKKELRQLDCGTANIVKRGSPVDVPKLLKKLKLRGRRHLHIFLTRNFEDRVAIITEPQSE